MIIGNKYELLERISRGSFGALYKGRNIRTDEFIAIKIEPRHKESDEVNTLKYEAKVYSHLKNVDDFVKMKWYGTNEKYNFLVIDLLGRSLKNDSVKNMLINNLELISHLGKKIIYKLMVLHENKIVHRDLKPDNILLNVENTFDEIYLVDFSFCKKYINSANQHIREVKTNKLIGSVNYISLNCHHLIEPIRRDDLESVVYILIYLYFGKLEWDYHMNVDQIYETKKNIINKSELPECFKNMLNYARALNFHERPNYFYFIDMLHNR
jgi:serine/threonine protein kinase